METVKQYTWEDWPPGGKGRLYWKGNHVSLVEFLVFHPTEQIHTVRFLGSWTLCVSEAISLLHGL